MGVLMLQKLLHESKYNINHEYLQDYFDFLNQCQVNELTDNYEKHHILPRSLFPELTKNRSNIIKLKPRDHFLAHYHLARLIKEKETIFAFNQMKRVLKKYESVIQDVESLSMLYEEFKLELSCIISKQNTGWFEKLTEDEKASFRNSISERTKGKVPVKYPDGTTCLIDKSHADYISGLVKQIHVGTKRSNTTKEIMKKTSSPAYRGYPYHDPETKTVKYFKRGDEPKGWIKGSPVAENSGKPGASWYHNPIDKKQRRFYSHEVPEGWLKGRINFGNAKPFSKEYQPS